MVPYSFPYESVDPYAPPDETPSKNITLCIDKYCFLALQQNFAKAWNDGENTTYLWIKL